MGESPESSTDDEQWMIFLRCGECREVWPVLRSRVEEGSIGMGIICPECDSPRRLVVKAKRKADS